MKPARRRATHEAPDGLPPWGDTPFEVVASPEVQPTCLNAHPDLAVPSLPLRFPRPIGLTLLESDTLTYDQDDRSRLQRLFGPKLPGTPLALRVGWALKDRDPAGVFLPDLLDVDVESVVEFYSEWDRLSEEGLMDGDEWQNESPSVLRRGVPMSAPARAVFAALVHQRSEIAETPETLLVESEDPGGFTDSGFTLMHVATGISASFYTLDGLGQVLAKSYSNPFRPRPFEDLTAEHFLGYGVGRRLYLAAHALWPEVRWEDASARSTSQSLRRTLHQKDPYTWQDRRCLSCCSAWRTSTSEQLLAFHT